MDLGAIDKKYNKLFSKIRIQNDLTRDQMAMMPPPEIQALIGDRDLWNDMAKAARTRHKVAVDASNTNGEKIIDKGDMNMNATTPADGAQAKSSSASDSALAKKRKQQRR